VSTSLVDRKRGREALVDVLGGVHDDGQREGTCVQPLARGDAEGFFVDVEHVGLQLPNQPSETAWCGIGMPVDVPRPSHRKLEDLEVFCREPRLAIPFGPHGRHDKCDIDAGRSQRSFPLTMSWVAAAVIDA
jgi:hypothetical protein